MITKKKPIKGGKLPGAGRPVGSKSKISGVKILDAVHRQMGKPFEQLLAEGYHASIIACDMNARISYEKMILSKVVAEKHELDIHSMGQSLVNNFKFNQAELPDWSEPRLKIVNAESK